MLISVPRSRLTGWRSNSSPAQGTITTTAFAAYAIRAVVYATLPTREHAQRQIDYLTTLPIEAWRGVVSLNAADLREATLAECAWRIATLAAN